MHVHMRPVTFPLASPPREARALPTVSDQSDVLALYEEFNRRKRASARQATARQQVAETSTRDPVASLAAKLAAIDLAAPSTDAAPTESSVETRHEPLGQMLALALLVDGGADEEPDMPHPL